MSLIALHDFQRIALQAEHFQKSFVIDKRFSPNTKNPLLREAYARFEDYFH